MKKILKSQSGNIALAMLLAVVAMMSGLSISSMSVRDTVAAQADLENIQSLHFLRAETFRGQAFLETAAKIDPGLGGGVRTHLREVAITSSHFAKTYTMQSQISRLKTESEGTTVIVGGQSQSGSTGAGENQYLVRSLIESKTGVGQTAYFSTNKSVVRKYSELTIVQDTGPVFMYFTDKELDPQGQAVRFDGRDYFDGPVHSNEDIWIRNTAGTANPDAPGWPRFDALVTTSGVVRVYGGASTYPRDQVFHGGLYEEYETYEFPSEMSGVRNNGQLVGPPTYDANNIIMVEVASGSYTGAWGKVQAPRRARAKYVPTWPYNYQQQPDVYNYFPVTDTVWVPLSGGSCNNRSNFVNSKLWIRGQKTTNGQFASFSGFQTWGAADTLYIIGDILIDGTSPPNDPISNRGSMVGLISEKSVILKYGFWNPLDTLREHTNMGADAEHADPAGGGVFIYAAIAALNDGGTNAYKDGVFTFEYQHPHGSIPAVVINVPGVGDTLFDWIDLHRNKYPQTPSQVWPPLLDYPWYNPLWPERAPYLMRGTINIWGGVSQKRRGFVRRNYVNDPNNNPNGVWDIPVDFCGGSSAPNPIQVQLYANPNVFVTLQTRDYPGANSSNQVGYRKNYQYDKRMYKLKPPDWPHFKRQGERLPMEHGNWLLKRPPRALL